MARAAKSFAQNTLEYSKRKLLKLKRPTKRQRVAERVARQKFERAMFRLTDYLLGCSRLAQIPRNTSHISRISMEHIANLIDRMQQAELAWKAAGCHDWDYNTHMVRLYRKRVKNGWTP